jgi:hypothetical protein
VRSCHVRVVPLALGLVALVLGVAARRASEPTSILWGEREYDIVTRVEDEAECFDFVAGGVTAFTECGSLDTLCDRPQAFAFDANGDSVRDIYVTTCRGPILVTWRDGAIGDERLGELHPGWWARQVLDGGTELLIVGALLGLAGLVTLVVAAAVR